MIITAQKLIKFLSKVPPMTPIITLTHTDSSLTFINEPELRSRENIAMDPFLGQGELDKLEEDETQNHDLFVFVD